MNNKLVYGEEAQAASIVCLLLKIAFCMIRFGLMVPSNEIIENGGSDNMSHEIKTPDETAFEIKENLPSAEVTGKWQRVVRKFVLAAIGSIPWVGGFMAAAASIPADEAKVREDLLRAQWLEEHHTKLQLLRSTLGDISLRFEKLGPTIEERIQSSEYLALVRQAFRSWDQAETEDKRRYIGNLITNAAGTRVCSDDVVRLFISWLDLYHESHLAVIREIYKNPGSTRYDIWIELYGEIPREDSAEADLYKLLIRDMSTGGVIRQARDVNEAGQFVRHRPMRRKGPASTTVETAFEDTKQYVLTELGKQFVHYSMSEVVERLWS